MSKVNKPTTAKSDFWPPEFNDEKKIDIPLVMQQQLLVRRFGAYASSFRSLGNDGLAEHKLEDACGKTVIEAYNLSLIPSSFRKLIELILWHTGNHAEVPAGERRPQLMYVRCPANLFNDIRGGHLLIGTLIVDRNGNKSMKDSRMGGGIMPCISKGNLDLSRNDQSAATCEMLADLINTPVKRGGRKGKRGRKAEYDERLDKEIEAAWTRAFESKTVTKEEFCKDHENWNLTVAKLDQLLSRCRQRRIYVPKK